MNTPVKMLFTLYGHLGACFSKGVHHCQIYHSIVYRCAFSTHKCRKKWKTWIISHAVCSLSQRLMSTRLFLLLFHPDLRTRFLENLPTKKILRYEVIIKARSANQPPWPIFTHFYIFTQALGWQISKPLQPFSAAHPN